MLVDTYKNEVEKLPDHLLASLETLRNPAPVRDVEELVDQLMHLLERKEESQPELTKIVIESVDSLEASRRGSLEDACKALGVSLEEWRPEASYRWPGHSAW